MELRRVGERIRALRGTQTQAEFSSKIGVSRTALANYELGNRLPGREVLDAICAATETPVTISWLLLGESPAGEIADVGGESLEELAQYLRRIISRYKDAGLGPPAEITSDEYLILRVLQHLELGERKAIFAPLGMLIDKDNALQRLFSTDDLSRLKHIVSSGDFSFSERMDDILKELEGMAAVLKKGAVSISE